jgi:hypothetical protein
MSGLQEAHQHDEPIFDHLAEDAMPALIEKLSTEVGAKA